MGLTIGRPLDTSTATLAAQGPAARSNLGGGAAKGAPGEFAKKLETVIANVLVSGMLPKDISSFYGKGAAGEVWRQMLSQELADAIARGGGIGFAERLQQRIAAETKQGEKP